jgi:hypothetical protein
VRARLATIRVLTLAAAASGLVTLASAIEPISAAASQVRSTHALPTHDGANACAKYKGPRLYGSVYRGSGQVDALAWKLAARSSTPLICTLRMLSITGDPGGMVADAAGKLWVMDSEHAALDAFPEGANGEASPAQMIAGSNTLLLTYANGSVQHPAIDSTGNIWVPEWYGGSGYLAAYDNQATGNVAPVATIGYGDKGVAEGFNDPSAIAFDDAGNLYVANAATQNTVLVFAPPFYDTEQPVAVWHTGQPEQFFMAGDGTNVYVATELNLLEFKGGLKSGGQYSIMSTHFKNGRGGSFDLKTDSRGRVYFPMDLPPKRKDPGTIAILPSSPDTLKGAEYIFNTFNGVPVSNIAISP